MKKILIFAAAMASMLFAASCQKENFSGSEQVGNVVTATFTVQAPGLPGTKAVTSADQQMVGDGRAADNLVFAVYDETGAELVDLRQGDWVNQIGDNQAVIKFDNSENPQTTVTVKLVRGKEYSFVCWAQNEAATCYDFLDMKNIGISYTDYNAANNDLRDAFYAYAETNGKVTENFSQTITLSRPFAQVNVGTTDFIAAEKAGLEIDNLYSTVTVKNAATVLETFTGKATNPVAATFAYAHAVAPDYDLVINKNKVVNDPKVTIADKYGWLAMNYVLVADGTQDGEASALAEVSFEVREGENTVLTSYDVPNVPIQRNYRTNIVGGLLTAEGTINIIIDPIFNGEYVVNVWDGYTVETPSANTDATEYYVTKASELAWVAEQVNKEGNTFEGVTVYLTSDIDLASQVWTPIGAGETPFKGTFEVLHNTSLLTKATPVYYAIYGLNVNYTEGPAGLFGWINGTVKNVNLVNPQVTGQSFVGAVAGKIFNSGLVDGCSIDGGSVYGNHYVGGVVGYAYGSVTNCVVDAVTVTGKAVAGNEDLDGDKVGGVLGFHPADAVAEVSGNQVVAVAVAAKRDAGALVGAANGDNVKGNHIESATVGSAEALIEKNAGVVVGRVLAGTLNPKANTYNHEQITVNGVQAEPAVIEFTAAAASEEALPAEGGEYVINVTSNVAWTVVAPEALTVVPAAGEGNAEVVVTVPANELYEDVTFEVSVVTEEEAEVKSFSFVISQVAAEPPFKAATVAEFLAAAEDATIYELTGVITSVSNTTYGNFYLKDATGEVLIYGLCSPEGEQKYWEASGAKVGDTITVQTVRTSYNGAAQGKNAIFVKLTPFVAQASEWGVVGDLNNWGVSKDIVMYTTWHTENLFVAYDVEIKSGAFKVRANNAWNDAKNYGLEVAGSIYADKSYKVITGSGSQNATPMVYGKYDVYFDLTNKRVALMTPGKAYAEAEDGGKPVVVVAGLKDHEWGVVGSFNNWVVANYVVAEVKGDWAVAKNVNLAKNAEFKFAADKAWTLSYGTGSNVNVGTTYTTYNNGGNMKFVGEAGAYDIYFSLVDASFYMTEAAASTPLVVELSAATKPCADFPDTSTGVTVKTTYTIGEYEWTFAPSSGNKFSWYPTDKYILWGKSGGYILMPAVDGRKLTSVTILTGKGASTSVMVGVYNEAGTLEVNGGAAIKLAEKNAEFSWSLTDTEVNTPYQLRITSAHNAQLQKLVLVYE